jgi:hypothetical protein
MEILLNKDLTRNRSFRPFIDQENLNTTVSLYDPNGQGYSYGLYDTPQPGCQFWENAAYKYMKENNYPRPIRKVTTEGQTVSLKPMWMYR